MHGLIYAGSLKVIPAVHSSLIGTHSSTVGFLGLSDGWAVPTQLFRRGVALSLSEEQAKEEMENEKKQINSTQSSRKAASTDSVSLTAFSLTLHSTIPVFAHTVFFLCSLMTQSNCSKVTPLVCKSTPYLCASLQIAKKNKVHYILNDHNVESGVVGESDLNFWMMTETVFHPHQH